MKSEMTSEGEKWSIDREGIVHFRFEEVDWLELSSLNHQNSLGEIVFSMIEDRKKEKLVLSVDLMGSYGLCGEFTAQRASIVSVTPPNGKRED